MSRKNHKGSGSTRFAGAKKVPSHATRHPPEASPPGHRNQVRIIGGEWRGRKLHFPQSPAIRPTPDRVRETVFNWLQSHVAGLRCLVLFAGSGALGFEALSRGAREVVFVETDPDAIRHVAQMLQTLKCDRGKAVAMDAFGYLAQAPEPFDLVFLDPPFADRALPRLCSLLETRGWLQPGAHVYLEDSAASGAPELPAGWTLLRSKRAGEVGYHLARRQ
jgi:16S rRNA (guanine966-N2)-methyltransferase